MSSFLELVLRDNDFRQSVCRLLNQTFPPNIPTSLYKYCGLHSYVLNNLVADKISLTRAGMFNDIYDSTIHTNIQTQKIEDESNLLDAVLRMCCKNNDIPMTKEDLKKDLTRIANNERKRNFDYLVQYIGCYIGSFSTDHLSKLMWAHYADNNRGICLEYNFTRLTPSQSELQKFFFPISYRATPLDSSSLIGILEEKYSNNLELAIITSLLSKSNDWVYEQEWRIFMPFESPGNGSQYMSILAQSSLQRVILGRHFLLSLFSRSSDFVCNGQLDRLKVLLQFCINKEIILDYAFPSIGSYDIQTVTLHAIEVLEFLKKTFKDKYPENIKYYYSIQSEFLDQFKIHF